MPLYRNSSRTVDKERLWGFPFQKSRSARQFEEICDGEGSRDLICGSRIGNFVSARYVQICGRPRENCMTIQHLHSLNGAPNQIAMHLALAIHTGVMFKRGKNLLFRTLTIREGAQKKKNTRGFSLFPLDEQTLRRSCT